jgi:hypothetical protein
VVKIKTHTSNWSHLTLIAIGYKLGDFTKMMQGGGKEVGIILLGHHENSGIIGIKRRTNCGSSPT